jgi:hypothetical protein
MKGICNVCGTKKSQFMRATTTGKGFLNNAIEKIGDLRIEFHLAADKGENVSNGSFNNQQKYSYCGPGTKYEQRVRKGYRGINELDRVCKLHDQFYNENMDTKIRNISDVALAHRAEEIAKNPMYDSIQKRYANFVSGIMKKKTNWDSALSQKTRKGVLERRTS